MPTKEMETTYALRRVLSTKKKTDGQGEALVDAAAVNALPSFSKQTASKKMPQSVGPGVKNVTVEDPYLMKRTVSKTHFMESGEGEIEAVEEQRRRFASRHFHA